MINKRGLKYRLKMQRKYEEVFAIKENNEIGDVENMRKYLNKLYTTDNYFLEVMIANIPDIRIVDFKRKEDGEHETTFEYPSCREIELNSVIENVKCRAYRNLSNFDELKRNRKAMLDDYYKRIHGEL